MRSDSEKKQILLRVSPSLWDALHQWAEEDFRSVNAQIEYLLTQAVIAQKKGRKNDSPSLYSDSLTDREEDTKG